MRGVVGNDAADPAPGCQSPPSSPDSSPIMTPETSDDEDEDEDARQIFEAACEDADAGERLALGTAVGAGRLGYGVVSKLPMRPLTSLEKHEEEGEELHLPHTSLSLGEWNEEEDDKFLRDMFAALSEPRSLFHDTGRLHDAGADLPRAAITTMKTCGEDNEELGHFPKAAQDDWDVEVENALEQFISSSESSHHDEDDFFHDASVPPELYYGALLSPIRKADRETLESDINATPFEEMSWSRRRILQIQQQLLFVHMDETVPYLSVVPIDGNMGNCLACMEGAPDTPYAGGIFWLHLDFPPRYPAQAPVVTFLTPVYHPNIDETGSIRIDILGEAWTPCLQVRTLLLSILSVLHSPIVDGMTPMPEIAEKFLDDNDVFCDIVRIYTANADGSRPNTSHLTNRSPAEYSSERSHGRSLGSKYAAYAALEEKVRNACYEPGIH